MELSGALGAVGLPFAGEGIGLNACGVLQVDLHAVQALGGHDVDVLGGLAAEVQARF